MKKMLAIALLGSLLGGCTGDTRVLFRDIGDHVTQDLLDSVFGVLFTSGGEQSSDEQREEGSPSPTPTL